MLVRFLLLFVSVHYTYSAEQNKKAKPTFTFQDGGNHVFVFDNMINQNIVQTLKHYISGTNSYSFYYPDPYERDNRTAREGHLHWNGPINPSFLIKTKFWPGVRRAFQSLPEDITQGRRYLPYDVYGTLLRRGDFTVPFEGDPEHPDTIYVHVYMSTKYTNTTGCEQTFYSGADDEIIGSVFPKSGRLVVWTGNISTLIRSPLMGEEQTKVSLIIKLTPHKELFFESCKKYEAYLKKAVDHAAKPFPYTDSWENFKIDQIDPSKHLLGKYHDKDGNMIAFFDDILPKELLDQLRTYVTHNERAFHHSDYSTASSESNDNVRFLVLYKPEKVLKTPYWEAVALLSRYMSNTTGWHPYDVSTNHITHAHHTRIHIDCTLEEYEYTFLLYLNPNWDENKYAETSFYDYAPLMDPNDVVIDKGAHPNEMYDFVAAAIPKYGRIAIFRNLIPHSARPPSPNFLGARYTFPVKVSESFRQARAKMLMEALDYKPDDAPDHPLFRPLKDGEYGPLLKDEKRDWVETELKRMMGYKKEMEEGQIKILGDSLLPAKFRS